MKREKEQVTSDRRNFLKLAGAGAVLTGAAAAGSTSASAQETVDDRQGRYQETDHVRKVYDLSRF
ncbi:MAG: twin-arginine translocation signal domain-containing protein [Hyphomicrobiaceae bacterium]